MSVTRVAYAAEGWGEGELWFDGPLLVWHELPAAQRPVREADRGKGSGETGRFPKRPNARSGKTANAAAPEVGRIVHALERYFHGERVDLASVRLELDDLTPFQRAIAAALRRVPWGEIVSYRDLAHAAGYANAQRAAGTFCARNRFPLFLPCHRVVSANGLGGYGSLGADYKRRLLELEGVTV